MIKWYCLHRMWRDTTNPDSKLMPPIYDLLTQKVQVICKARFVTSSEDSHKLLVYFWIFFLAANLAAKLAYEWKC